MGRSGLRKAEFHKRAYERGALLTQLIAQELLRAVEEALCLLDGGLNLFDLPICRTTSLTVARVPVAQGGAPARARIVH